MMATVLGGCGGSGTKPDAGAKPAATVKNAPKLAPATTKPAAGAKLDENITVVQQLDMVSFDPINTSDLSNRYIITNIYSYLFAQDEYLNGVPEPVSYTHLRAHET